MEKRTSCEKQKQQQEQKIGDVGAQSFAVLEWYSYYGKKSVLDSMIYHKTRVTYHLLRPPGWTT